MGSVSMSGWYPDPSGAAGRYRYWDGAAWSDTTTTDPKTPPPVPVGQPAPGRGGGKAWIVALVALAVVTAIAVALVLRGTGGIGNFKPATEDTNSDTPTGTAWDETSTVTTPPPPPTNSGGQLVTCPFTDQVAGTAQVAGKLTADTLQVDQIPGWNVDSKMYLQSVYDVHAQTDIVYPGWMSNIAVGLLHNSDGFVDLAASAQMMMQCFASSGYYLNYTGREDIIPGEQIDVSGHAAWRIESKIFVSGERVPGDVADVIIVDLGGTKDHLGIFFSSYSIGDMARQTLVDRAIASLAVIG